MADKKTDTICVQGGYFPGNGETRQLPIYQSTTWRYGSSDDMGRLFDLESEGYFYSRLSNPTNDAVAKKICELEGGKSAMLTSSGQAANLFAVINICGCNDHIVASSDIYGGTSNLFTVTLKRFGIECTLVNPDASAEEISSAFRPNTKLLFGETIANPSNVVLDIEKFADIAHSHGVPLIVDNTFATPVHCRPIEWGCDIVTHSTTKYMDGHAMTIGGAIVDSGNFDWEKYAGKYPGLTSADESYHGIIYTKRFGEKAFINKATVQLMRDIGAVQSPVNAWILDNGLESLAVRMEKHCSNALTVAGFLLERPEVDWVHFPELENDKYHELAKKYLPNGGSGVIAFGLKGGRNDAVKFMDRLKMISIATHVADARTCILHPASHTHRQLSEEGLRLAGVDPSLIRLSVGIENPYDIIEDIKGALA